MNLIQLKDRAMTDILTVKGFIDKLNHKKRIQ